jgi:hypothetical protein
MFLGPASDVETTADHLGHRIRLDYTNDDQTFVIARIVRIGHKQIGTRTRPRRG